MRQAGAAFMQMRDRIQRQIRQRTEMLAGVSHDLRTPLTRMKLALEMMPGDPVAAELKSRRRRNGAAGQCLSRFRPRRGHRDPGRNRYRAADRGCGGGRAPRRPGAGPSIRSTSCSCRCGRTRCGAASATWSPTRAITAAMSGCRRVPLPDGIDILVDDDGPGVPTGGTGARVPAFRAARRLAQPVDRRRRAGIDDRPRRGCAATAATSGWKLPHTAACAPASTCRASREMRGFGRTGRKKDRLKNPLPGLDRAIHVFAASRLRQRSTARSL